MTAISVRADDSWEWVWAPYDTSTYEAVLDHVSPDDVVLDIGAGDFRLARELAHQARQVYALECQQSLIEKYAATLPDNCHVFAGDARWLPFPKDVTVAVLLMRHCSHLVCYWNKLTAVSCSKLITNARWGMGVEAIDLNGLRSAYSTVSIGWYACLCGHTGFVPGPAEQWSETLMDTVWEVGDCPKCATPNSAHIFN